MYTPKSIALIYIKFFNISYFKLQFGGYVIMFLETRYNVESHIASEDTKMPQTPNEETAKQIKYTIKSCNKFLLLATDKAIQSKWRNWELGFGDAQKFEKIILH